VATCACAYCAKKQRQASAPYASMHVLRGFASEPIKR